MIIPTVNHVDVSGECRDGYCLPFLRDKMNLHFFGDNENSDGGAAARHVIAIQFDS